MKQLLLLGQLPPSAQDKVVAFCDELAWPVLADVTSQVKFCPLKTGFQNPHAVAKAILESPELVPDEVLFIGGQLTSKSLLNFLENPPCPITHIQQPGRSFNPFGSIQKVIETDIHRFLEKPLPLFRGKEGMGANADYFTLLQKFDTPFEIDPASTVIQSFLDQLPPESQLMLGNSMSIRLVDQQIHSDKRFRIFANRGASGIDGQIATACGIADGSGKPVFLILGDLSFLHDLNSLALVQHAKAPVIILVLNDNGGGIFKKLPAANITEYFERYFQTPHGLQFEAAAALFKLAYYRGVNAPINLTKSAIVEIGTA